MALSFRRTNSSENLVDDVVIGNGPAEKVAHVANEYHSRFSVEPRLVGTNLASQVGPSSSLHHASRYKADFLEVFGVEMRKGFSETVFLNIARVANSDIITIPQLATVAA